MSSEAEPIHSVMRPLDWGDLDGIMEIELAAYPVPWTRGIFSDCIRVGYDCWGLLSGPGLVGYSIQTDAAGECHLLNLCVAPRWQRRGYGAMLLENAIRIARKHLASSMFLEVRPSNLAGIALYRSRGFVVIGRRPGYYSSKLQTVPGPADASTRQADESREDALVMRLALMQCSG